MENEYSDASVTTGVVTPADSGLPYGKQLLQKEVETNEIGGDGKDKEKEDSGGKKQMNRDRKLNRFTRTCWFEYNCRMDDEFDGVTETSEESEEEEEDDWESEDASEEEEDIIFEEPELPSAKNHIDTEVDEMEYSKQSFSLQQVIAIDEFPKPAES